MRCRPLLQAAQQFSLLLLLLAPPSYVYAQRPLPELSAGPRKLFDHAQSLSFMNTGVSYHIAYMDGSSLRGYVGEDILQLGPHYTRCDFVGARSSAGSWADGILGLSLRDPSDTSHPVPVLYRIAPSESSQNKRRPLRVDAGAGGDAAAEHVNPVAARIFSFFATWTGGELMFGGYDMHLVKHPPVFLPVMPTAGVALPRYQVPVTKVLLGDQDLLPEMDGTGLEMCGILDTGTSYIYLPDVVRRATLRAPLYQRFTTALASSRAARPDLTIVFQSGTDIVSIRIPYRDYVYVDQYQGGIELTAVREVQSNWAGLANCILLGDPLFRNAMVVHDLSNAMQARIGIAPLADHAAAASAASRSAADASGDAAASLPRNASAAAVTHVPLLRRQPPISQESPVDTLMYWAQQSVPVADVPDTPPAHMHAMLNSSRSAGLVRLRGNGLQYFANVTIGTPRQGPFMLQVDTGSTVTAVFAEPLTASFLLLVLLESLVVLSVVVVVGVVVVRRARRSNAHHGFARIPASDPRSARSSPSLSSV